MQKYATEKMANKTQYEEKQAKSVIYIDVYAAWTFRTVSVISAFIE